MYQKWEAALFQQLINDLFSKINDNQVTWFQFNLILKSGCIKYRSLSEQLKFRKYFQQNESITKQNLKYLMLLNSTLITNNKRFYIIGMKQSVQMQEHKPNRCFTWWKQWMTKKYGPDIKWFDIICMQKDCFKLKIFDFKKNLAILLRDTDHSKCFTTIAAFFPKTQRNQIQFSIFMSTLKVSIRPTYINTVVTKKDLSKLSHSKTLTSKSKLSAKSYSNEKSQRPMTQTSQTFYITELGQQIDDKQQKQHQNYAKGRVLRKKSVSKTITAFYSVPVKDNLQKQKKNERYRSMYI